MRKGGGATPYRDVKGITTDNLMGMRRWINSGLYNRVNTFNNQLRAAESKEQALCKSILHEERRADGENLPHLSKQKIRLSYEREFAASDLTPPSGGLSLNF